MVDVTRTHLTRMSQDQRIWSAATIFARVTLAAGFLSAVADRFGLWGEAGTNQVGWGNFETFTQYVQTLAPYLPARLVTAAAWGGTWESLPGLNHFTVAAELIDPASHLVAQARRLITW